jgi:hypothetical protein
VEVIPALIVFSRRWTNGWFSVVPIGRLDFCRGALVAGFRWVRLYDSDRIGRRERVQQSLFKRLLKRALAGRQHVALPFTPSSIGDEGN